ncbi:MULTISPECIES: major capsid protein [unclassified Acinetobacter]|uniref:major capsid protein n=1 Tax=unclassified Acinetobacter TaxID=196816 RepID=UPI0015D156E2|nr:MULTISPECIES: major capsid protein [unclassified Acinetobacter]
MENVQKFKPTLAQKAGVVAAIGMALAGSTANAAGEFTLDTSSVVTTITGGVAVVSSIGLAVLSLVVVVKLFKWARSAL